jgi:2-polyprenyl-6-methoxyphenol hydroxylase-like FAD-dependent oxidoreductase
MHPIVHLLSHALHSEQDSKKSGVIIIVAAGRTLLQLSDGQQLSCDVFVGADGGNSVAAQHLGLPQANYAGYVGYR